MADVAAMDIVIGADVSKAIQGLEGLSTELADLSKTGVTSVNQLSRAMDTLRAAAAKTTDVGTLAKYNQALEKLAGESTRLKNVGLGEGFKKTAQGAGAASYALTNFGRVAQDAAYGPLAIANNLNPLIEGLSAAAREAKETGKTLGQTLLKSLVGGGGLSIAFSLVTAAIGFAYMGLSAWTRGMSGSAKAVDSAEKKNEDYAKSIESIDDNTTKSTQKQLAELNVWLSIARDKTASYNSQIDAVDKLQKQFPATFGLLNDEKIKFGDVTEAINKTTQALINQAIAQGAISKAAEAGARVFELQQQVADANKEVTKSWDDIIAAQKRGEIAPALQGDELIASAGQLGAAFQTAQINARKLTVSLGDATKEQQKYLDQATQFGKLTSGVTDIDKAWAKLTETLDQINKKAQATGASFKDEKISAYKTALDDLIKAGLSPASAGIQNLVKNIRDSGGSFEKIGKVDHKKIKDAADVISNLTEELRALNVEQTEVGGDMRQKMISAIDLAVTALIKMGIAGTDPRIQNLLKTEKDITQTLNHQKEILESLVNLRPKIDLKFEQPKDLKDIKLDRQFIPVLEVQIKPVMDKEALKALKWKVMGEQAAKDFNKAFQALIKQAIEDISAEIGKTLGNLFTGQKDAFAGLFDVLAGVLEQLGKIAITTGVGVLAIKTSLKTLNPFVAIAAGIALVALSQIARNSIKQTAMAEGGIVTGPTRALIGEAGPEVVFPLDRLREFIRPNNAQVVVLETRVRGNDLWLSQSRTNERRGRTY